MLIVNSTRRPRVDLSGTRQGKLKILRFLHYVDNLKTTASKAYYEVQCDCGTKKITWVYKRLQSCGCLRLEMAGPAIAKRNAERSKYGKDRFARDIMRSYLHRAKKKGIPFELDFKVFKWLILQDCTFCGSEPKSFLRYKRNVHLEDAPPYYYNGIDRLDNSKGYTMRNCLPCCEICNKAKRDMSISDFQDWLANLVAHFQINIINKYEEKGQTHGLKISIINDGI